MTRRGYTLVELMVALAILFLGVGLLVSEVGEYQRACARARAVEAIARALDQEMEHLRACPDAACLLAARTTTATTAGLSSETQTWARPRVRREVRRGPDGTYEVTLTAERPELMRPRRLVALVEVPR